MITEDMTIQEIASLTANDIAMISSSAKVKQLINQVMRVHNTTHTRFCNHTLMVGANNQQYIVFAVNTRRYVSLQVFAVCRRDKKDLYYQIPVVSGDYYRIYSTHFFERYRERMKMGDVTLEHAMSKFVLHDMISMPIYYSDDANNSVCISKNGLLMVGRNEQSIPVYTTFLSKDILLGEQRTIFNRALPLFKKYKEEGEDAVIEQLGLLTRLMKPIYESFNKEDED